MKKRDLTEEESRECAALKLIFDSKKKELGLSQQSVGEDLDITQGGVGHYLNGKNALNLRVASHFSNILRVPISSFSTRLSDEQKKLSRDLQTSKTSHELEIAELNVPLISWVSAGTWCESPDNYHPGDAEEWLPRPKGASHRSFALRVVGDSMTSPIPGQRSYPHGTIIYIDPEKALSNGARVVGRVNGEYTFKLYIEDVGRKYLKPINPTFDKTDITDDVAICGVVIGSYLPE